MCVFSLLPGIVFATLWDSIDKKFVGMLTITDFIDILLHFFHRPNALTLLNDLEDHHIRAWRGSSCLSLSLLHTHIRVRFLRVKFSVMGQRTRPQNALVYVTPKHTLFDALRTLRINRIHRLPVMSDESSLLFISTYEGILEYVWLNVLCVFIMCVVLYQIS